MCALRPPVRGCSHGAQTPGQPARGGGRGALSDAERHRLIVELLRDRPFASVRELTGRLGVSAATVRRDIEKIHAAGGARKVYGGISALAGRPHGVFARPYDENLDLAVEAKRAIAELAENLVADGDTLIVNGGSTCFHFGCMLAARNVRVFTNSMPLAAFLGEEGRCSLTIGGGELHREPRVIFAPGQASGFFASKYFVGAQGVSAEGLLESSPLQVRAIQELAERADQVIVLADSRKFAIRARNVSLPLGRVGTLVTDDALPGEAAVMLAAAEVEVRIAALGEKA